MSAVCVPGSEFGMKAQGELCVLHFPEKGRESEEREREREGREEREREKGDRRERRERDGWNQYVEVMLLLCSGWLLQR